jgi:hypothetical protein
MMDKVKLFDKDVDVSKVNFLVIRNWIATTINEIIPDDDIIVDYICELLTDEDTKPDIRAIQTHLISFIGESEAKKFCRSLWKLMLSGQTDKDGIPPELVEQVKKANKVENKEPQSNTGTIVDTTRQSYRGEPRNRGDRRERYSRNDRHNRYDRSQQGRREVGDGGEKHNSSNRYRSYRVNDDMGPNVGSSRHTIDRHDRRDREDRKDQVTGRPNGRGKYNADRRQSKWNRTNTRNDVSTTRSRSEPRSRSSETSLQRERSKSPERRPN